MKVLHNIRLICRLTGVCFLLQLFRVILLWWRRLRFLKSQNHIAPLASELSATPWEGVVSFASNSARIHDFRYELMKKYTDNFGGRIKSITGCGLLFGFRPLVMTVDDNIVKHILKDNFNNYLKIDLGFNQLFGDTILTVNHGPFAKDKGAFYKYQRRTASKLFTENKLAELVASAVRDQMAQVIKKIKCHIDSNSNAGFKLKECIFDVTFNIMCEVGFGHKQHLGNEKSPLQDSFDIAFSLSPKLIFDPLWQLPLSRHYIPSKKLIMQHNKILTDFFYSVVDARMLESVDRRSERGDLLSMFIDVVGDKQYTRDQLKDLMYVFVAGGRDTSASTMQWMIYYLASNPGLQENLFLETRKAVRSEDGEFCLDMEEIRNNNFLDSVLMETLRLHPPFGLLGKRAAHEDTLPNGMRIKEGTYVMFDVPSMGLDPTRYTDPHKFIPQRWIQPNKKAEKYDEFKFPVFLGGPRVCIGKSLAMRQIKMVVVSLVQKFKFSLHQNEAAEIAKKDVLYSQSSIYCYAGDLLVNAVKRESSKF